MALILSRVIQSDIARYINDLANQDWLREKRFQLQTQLYELIVNDDYYVECLPDEVLELLQDFHKYSLIDEEVIDQVMEYVWNYKYLNRFNGGPWVVHEEKAFQNIYKMFGLKYEEVEDFLKSAYD